MKKAQVSMEYMIIIAFVTAIIIPLIVVFTMHSSALNEQVIDNQVNQIANRIIENVESVYYLGNTCKLSFTINIPKNVEDIVISGREIVFYLKQHNGISEIVRMSTIPMNGTIKHSAGLHNIVIESKGDYIWISN